MGDHFGTMRHISVSTDEPPSPERGRGTSASEDRGRARPQSHRATWPQGHSHHKPENHRNMGPLGHKKPGKVLKVMKATSSLVLIHEALIRVRVTKLVYQIGLTTPFWVQGGGEKIAASKQQQATEHISAYPHISVGIDGTSPKLLS